MTGLRKHKYREPAPDGAVSLPAALDGVRNRASASLDAPVARPDGQFLTPGSIAALMDGMFECGKPEVRILDPGAGAGTLCAALVATSADAENPRPPLP